MRIFLICIIIVLFPFVLSAQANQEIWALQGSGNVSPFFNQQVRTDSNIVTFVADQYFCIQTPDERADLDETTSNAIFVLTNQARQLVALGDLINLTGTIIEFDGQTSFSSNGLTIEEIRTDVALPTATILNDDFPKGTPNLIPEWEQVEGMRVEIPAGTVCSPERFGEIYITAKSSRLFREPGIEFPGRRNLPVWDGNPEIILLDLSQASDAQSFLFAGRMGISTNGIIREGDDEYYLIADTYSLTGGPAEQAVDDRRENEVTIGSLNILQLDPGDNNYQIRKTKLVNYIIDQLKSPDILAVQEVISLFAMEEVAADIQAIDSSIQYQYMMEFGGGSIHTGFFIRRSIINPEIRQLGDNQFLSNRRRLHDRPPLLLQAKFNTSDPVSISILNLHMRSLNRIEETETKVKRHEQARSVARMVESLQNENLVLVGDMNAFEFSDGYVDVIAQISGQPSLGAEFEKDDIITNPLTNHSILVSPEERYSFIFRGNAQILDHCLTNELGDGIKIRGLQYARGNADNGLVYFEDESNTYRTSDHDGFSFFIALPDPVRYEIPEPIIPEMNLFEVLYPNPFTDNDLVKIQLGNRADVRLRLYAADGRNTFALRLVDLPIGTTEVVLPTDLPAGIYFLTASNGKETKTEKIMIGR